MTLDQEFNHERIAQLAWYIGELADHVIKSHADFGGLNLVSIDSGNGFVLAGQGLRFGLLFLGQGMCKSERAGCRQDCDNWQNARKCAE